MAAAKENWYALCEAILTEKTIEQALRDFNAIEPFRGGKPMETREVKAALNKCGNGGINIRVPLPKEWANKLGITSGDRNIIIGFNEDDGEIVIRKK